MLELTADEKTYLVEVLKADHKQMMHELHHTDTHEFENRLRRRLELNEAIARRL